MTAALQAPASAIISRPSYAGSKITTGPLSMAGIVSLVADACSVPGRDLMRPNRGSPAVSRARQIAMYLAAVDLELTMTAIAAFFGRDRTTVGHAVRVIEDRRDDPAFDTWLTELEANVL